MTEEKWAALQKVYDRADHLRKSWHIPYKTFRYELVRECDNNPDADLIDLLVKVLNRLKRQMN